MALTFSLILSPPPGAPLAALAHVHALKVVASMVQLSFMQHRVSFVETSKVIILLLKTMDSLKQLYSLAMDGHSHLRTETHQDSPQAWMATFSCPPF